MAYSKVILNGTTLIDVTQKTVTASTLLQGETALKNDGTDVTGTLVPSVDPELQSKSVSYTPTTSQQSATITADGGYDGLSSVSVTVDAMPSGSATTPATSITANPTISVSASGLITASVSGSQSVTPSVTAGYVASGTAGTVSVSGSNTQQLTVYNGEHHQPVPSDYTVTVSLTNPVNGSDFYSCDIYEQLTFDSSDPESGTSENPIGSISSATGSTEVTVPASSYGIFILLQGSTTTFTSTSNITCSGGVSTSETWNWDTRIWCEVTGNGTITISGTNWNDED